MPLYKRNVPVQKPLHIGIILSSYALNCSIFLNKKFKSLCVQYGLKIPSPPATRYSSFLRQCDMQVTIATALDIYCSAIDVRWLCLCLQCLCPWRPLVLPLTPNVSALDVRWLCLWHPLALPLTSNRSALNIKWLCLWQPMALPLTPVNSAFGVHRGTVKHRAHTLDMFPGSTQSLMGLPPCAPGLNMGCLLFPATGSDHWFAPTSDPAPQRGFT